MNTLVRSVIAFNVGDGVASAPVVAPRNPAPAANPRCRAAGPEQTRSDRRRERRACEARRRARVTDGGCQWRPPRSPDRAVSACGPRSAAAATPRSRPSVPSERPRARPRRAEGGGRELRPGPVRGARSGFPGRGARGEEKPSREERPCSGGGVGRDSGAASAVGPRGPGPSAAGRGFPGTRFPAHRGPPGPPWRTYFPAAQARSPGPGGGPAAAPERRFWTLREPGAPLAAQEDPARRGPRLGPTQVGFPRGLAAALAAPGRCRRPAPPSRWTGKVPGVLGTASALRCFCVTSPLPDAPRALGD